MLQKIWPVLLIAAANSVYHLISKNIPSGSNAFLTLVFTYLAAAASSFILFLFDRSKGSFSVEFSRLHPLGCILGIVIVGMELGGIYLYRTGWEVSRGSLVSHALGAVILLFAGALIYKETITLRQALGVIVCFSWLMMLTL